MRKEPKIKESGTGMAYSALGYRAVRTLTSDGVSSISASGDANLQFDRPRLVGMSRDLFRSNAIYNGMVNRSVAYIVGNGFQLQATSEDKDTNKKIESLWSKWRKKPEITGLLTGKQVERMLCREMLVAGDTGVIKTNKALVQLVESEQIVGNRNVSDDGIDKDKLGRPTGYWVGRYNRNGHIDLRTSTKIPAEHFLFLTDPDRPSSTRTVPPSQSSFAMLHRINDVCDAEAIAWQMLSRMAISITRAGGPEAAYNESREDEALSSTDAEGDFATRIHDLAYALVFHGEQGEEVKGIDRNLPGKDFGESIRMFLRMLGLPLGLPLELILLDWTKSNYSQSRAVIEQAYQTFREKQDLLVDGYYDPVFVWKLKQWVDQGLFDMPEDGISYNWIPPSFPWIDQQKEADAYGRKVELSFCTLTEACKSLGRDREEVIAGRRREVEEAIAIAADIKERTGVDVDWKLFAGLEAQKATAPKPETEPKPEEPANAA